HTTSTSTIIERLGKPFQQARGSVTSLTKVSRIDANNLKLRQSETKTTAFLFLLVSMRRATLVHKLKVRDASRIHFMIRIEYEKLRELQHRFQGGVKVLLEFRSPAGVVNVT